MPMHCSAVSETARCPQELLRIHDEEQTAEAQAATAAQQRIAELSHALQRAQAQAKLCAVAPYRRPTD